MFLSLRKHVRHWSNPLGRCFFQTERDDRTTLVWRAPEGTITAPVDGGGAWPGNTQTQAPPDWRPPRGLRGLAAVPVGSGRTGRTTRRRTRPHISHAGPTGVEGAGGTCRGAGGRRRGLAGLRGDAPSEARGADGSRAGRRPPAHTAAGPSGARNTSSAASAARTCAERNPYRPRNALIAGISRTACTRPAR